MSVLYSRPGAFETCEDDTDLNDLLLPAASAVTTREKDLFEADYDDLLEALSLVESVHFDETQHPRWPKGTPKGGQFIRVGQHFSLAGKQYQVAHVLKGKIVAHLTGGKSAQTIDVKVSKTAGFEPAHPAEVHVAKIEAPATVAVKGGKGQTSTVTAVSPYVDSSTHDPTIPIPAGSEIKPEEWKRFGKLDQEHYTELQERFGKWKPGAAKPLVDKAYTDYANELKKTYGEATGSKIASDVSGIVKTGYSMQYGSSSGLSLSLIGAIGHVKKFFSGEDAGAETFDTREHAMVLQGEHKAAVQWDLYNRAHSPDISAFHKSSDSTSFWDEFIGGKKRIFSGLSQSFHYRASFFGDTALATPLAIRHVLLASQSAQPIPGSSHFPGELEISVPEQMVLDKRSFSFTHAGHAANGKKLSGGARKWLESVTKVPVGGRFIDQLRDHFEKGESLPVPPEPAMIHMDGAGNKLWKDPEPDAWHGIWGKDKSLLKSGKEMLVGEYFEKGGKSYAITDVAADGTVTGKAHKGSSAAPTATVGPDEVLPVAQPVNTAGIKAGDYIQGLQGARYIVVSDPGDSSGYGLAYVEAGKDGTPNGSAFNFEGGGIRPFYKLEGHYAPKAVAVDGAPPFDGGAWTASAAPPEFVGKLKEGDKFKVEGEHYEVMQQMVGMNQTQIKNLETGKTGKINADYKTAILVPKEGYVAPPPEGQVLPKVGDILAINGEKWEVTGPVTLKNAEPGQWKLKRPGQSGVKVLGPDAPEWGGLHSPSDYVIGAKQKLRDYQVGEKFHMGAGAKQKPYEVLSHGGPGKPTVVRDISTGKEMPLSRNSSYAKLVPAGETALPDPAVPKSTPPSVDSPHDPTAWTMGDANLLGYMPIGMKVRTQGGGDFIITGKSSGQTGGSIQLTNLATGESVPDVAGTITAYPLIPKYQPDVPSEPLDQPPTKIVHTNFAKGDLVGLKELSPGDQFIHQGTKFKVVEKIPGEAPLVSEVSYGGHEGVPHQLAGGSDYMLVDFEAHAADAAAAPEFKVKEPPTVEPDSLSHVPGGFQGYGSKYASGAKASGGFSGKHDTIESMAVGTVFRDKSGALWKVKATGPNPIITNGKTNFQVDGALRGRAHLEWHELPGGDTSPPVGALGEDDAKSAITAVMKPNKTIKLSDLSKGDHFQLPSGIYTVDGMNSLGDVIAHDESGHAHYWTPVIVPSHVALSTPIETEPAAKVSPTVPTPPPYVSPPAGVDAHEASTLAVGDTFKDGNGEPLKVEIKGDWGLVAKDKFGNAFGLGPNDLVVPTATAAPEPEFVREHKPNIVGMKVANPAALQTGDTLGGESGGTYSVIGSTPEYVTLASDADPGAEFSVPHSNVMSTMTLVSQKNQVLPDSVPNTPNVPGGPITDPAGLKKGDVLTSPLATLEVVSNGPDGVVTKLAGTTSDHTYTMSYDTMSQIKLGHLQPPPVEKVDPGAKVKPTVATTWSPSTHVEGDWQKIHQFEVGQVFKGKTGGYHQIIGKNADGSAEIHSLKTGKIYTLAGWNNRRVQVPKDGIDTTKAEPSPPVGPKPDPIDQSIPMDSHTYQPPATGLPFGKSPMQVEMEKKYPLGSKWDSTIGAPSFTVTGHTAGGFLTVKSDQDKTTTLADADMEYATRAPSEAPAAPEKGAQAPEDAFGDVLKPFASNAGPGNAYKHPKLTTLGIGQQFRDKTGQTFYITGHSGSQTLYRSTAGGQTFSAHGNLRVKTHGLPQVGETAAPSPEHDSPVSPQDAAVKALQQQYGSLAVIQPIGSDFAAYKSTWGSGGAYKHPQIGELAHGAKFQDKNGNSYTFIAPYADNTAIIVSDDSKKPSRISRAVRVKLKG